MRKEENIVVEKSEGAWYIISVAAEKAEVHEQTLRHYERLGLISPARKAIAPIALVYIRTAILSASSIFAA